MSPRAVSLRGAAALARRAAHPRSGARPKAPRAPTGGPRRNFTPRLVCGNDGHLEADELRA
eukprot:7564863-Alexandrium_andersonii.AAC.1